MQSSEEWRVDGGSTAYIVSARACGRIKIRFATRRSHEPVANQEEHTWTHNDRDENDRDANT